MTPGLVLSAPASGSGKTVVTAALVRALARGGRRVSAFKVGPDYIDCGFHTIAAGRDCRTVDLWAMRAQSVRREVARCAEAADIVVGEGVMGLFDGSASGEGSTADVAALLGLPVVLVVDAGGLAQSAAALVAGYRDHRRDVRVAGVILNRVAGRAHLDMLQAALASVTTVFGHVARDPRFERPGRHLGLVQAQEHDDCEAFLETCAAALARTVDVEGLAAAARPLHCAANSAPPPMAPPGQRIALARDRAFSFLYPALAEGWRRGGAEILEFSPLANEAPPPDADAVFLPGGYPELHAGRIASNRTFLDGLRRAAGRGAVVYGECGGLMVLGRSLTDAGGVTHAMAGLLPVSVSMDPPRRHLGYRRMVLQSDGPLGRAGTAWRGHEFHYARQTSTAASPLFRASDARGRDLGTAGAVAGSVAASFLHIIDREAPGP